MLGIALTSLIFTFWVANVNAFQDIGDYGVDVSLAFDPYNLKLIRNPTYNVDNDNQMSNLYDVVDFDNEYNGQYDLDSLASQGYKTLVVEVTMMVWEYKDGYQRIFFYDDTSATSCITSGIFEHGSGYKEENSSQYTFYCELPLSALHDNDFVIRYGSSGLFQNDWRNNEVYVQVGASTEVRKTVNVWKIIWNNQEHTSYTYTQLGLVSN